MTKPSNSLVPRVGIIFLLALGCDSSDRRTTATVPTAKATPLESVSDGQSSERIRQPTHRAIGGIKFEIPAGWEEKSLSSTVLLAEFSLPAQSGPGRLTLSTAAGGTTANLDRWKGQFQRGPSDPEPKESKIAAAGQEVTMIEIFGSYSDMFGGGGPKSNWQLLGVAIPIDSQHNYFIKLTGPRETIAAYRSEFEAFVKSARIE